MGLLQVQLTGCQPELQQTQTASATQERRGNGHPTGDGAHQGRPATGGGAREREAGPRAEGDRRGAKGDGLFDAVKRPHLRRVSKSESELMMGVMQERRARTWRICFRFGDCAESRLVTKQEAATHAALFHAEAFARRPVSGGGPPPQIPRRMGQPPVSLGP